MAEMEVVAAAAKTKQERVRQLRFPPGYRFVPTEQELVDVYLRGKIEGHKLPLQVVNEVNILEWQPGSLVEAFKGYGEHKWYFFTVREPSSSNKEAEPNRKVRVPGVKATWKATGSLVPITARSDKLQDAASASASSGKKKKDAVGTKRVLIYHSSDADEDGKWSMHEYVLKDYSKIGQYALCSIQRKQHSDIVDNASKSRTRSKRKATTDEDMEDPEKTKRVKAASAEPAEGTTGVPLAPTINETVQKEKSMRGKKKAAKKVEEGTARTPLKQRSKNATKRPPTKGRNKDLMQEEQQQEQQRTPSSPGPEHVEPPLLPLSGQGHQALQQEQQQSAPCGAPAGLHAPLPLQGYTASQEDGGYQLGTNSPMNAEHASFQCDNLSQFPAQDTLPLPMFCSQEEQPPCFTGGDQFIPPADSNVIGHDQYHQLYQQLQEDDGLNELRKLLSFGGNEDFLYTGQHYSGQNMDDLCLLDNQQDNNLGSSGPYDQHQLYQQVNGGALGAQDQLPISQIHYDQVYSSAQSGQEFSGSPDGQFTSTLQSDQGDDSVRVSADGVSDDNESFVTSMVRDDGPAENFLDSQEWRGAATFQHKLPRSWAQQQHTANGHVCDGPPSCLVCAVHPYLGGGAT